VFKGLQKLKKKKPEAWAARIKYKMLAGCHFLNQVLTFYTETPF